MLAGNVTVDVVGGSLVITGDNQANDIAITQFGATSADQFVLKSGSNPTTLNGQTGPLLIEGVTRDFRIDLRGQADTVVLYLADVPRDLIMTSGDGGSHFDAAVATVGRNLRITHGTGFDTVDASSLVVMGTTRITSGPGGSHLQLHNATLNGNCDLRTVGFSAVSMVSTQFEGNLSVRSDGGLYTLEDTQVAGRVTGTFGEGHKTWEMSHSTLSGDLRLSFGAGESFFDSEYSTIGGNVQVRDTAEASSFRSYYDDFAKSIVISNGSGGGTVRLFESHVEGDLRVTNQAGYDYTELYGTSFNSVRVSNGDGGSWSNTIWLATDRDVRFTSGAGNESMYWYGGNVDGLTVTTGAGDAEVAIVATVVRRGMTIAATESVRLDLVRMEVVGTTAIRGGNDSDDVQIDDSEFYGSFSVQTRGGHDYVGVEIDETRPDRTTFYAAARFSLGDGNDSLVVGWPADFDRRARFFQQPRFDGGRGIDLLDYATHDNEFPAGPPDPRGFEFVM